MNLKIFIAVLIVSLGFRTEANAQKIKDGDITISFSQFSEREDDIPLKGKQKILFGIVKIKEKGKKTIKFRFYAPLDDRFIQHLSIRSSEDELLQPRLYYDAETRNFIYRESASEIRKEAMRSESRKEIVLSGVLVWLKLRQEQEEKYRQHYEGKRIDLDEN